MNEVEIECQIESGEILIEALIENIEVNNGGGNILIRNSNNTFTDTATSSPYTLPNTTVNVFVNGVLNQTATIPTLDDVEINITP